MKKYMAFMFALIVMTYYPLTAPNVEAVYTLNEDFNSNSLGWFEADDSNKTLEIKNGKYYIEQSREKGLYITSTKSGLRGSEDFTIETSIEWISGVDNHAYGIVWSFFSYNFYYEFGITPDGKFVIYEVSNGKYSFFAGWTESPHIAKKSVNKLSVNRRGDTLQFRINGESVFEMPYRVSIGRGVGIAVNFRQKIAIDYFRVSQGINIGELESWELTGLTDNNDNCENAKLFFSNAERLFEDSPDKARELFYQAMKLCPGSRNTIYNYSIALYKTKYYKKAIGILERNSRISGITHTKMHELLIYLRLLRKENVTRGRTLASIFSEQCPGLDFTENILRDSLDHSSDELRAKYDKHFTLLPLESDFPTFTPSPARAGAQSSKKTGLIQGMSIFQMPEECKIQELSAP